MSEQPVSWHPRTWQKRWQEQSLPCPHVLDELREEHASHGTIRRSFVFSYQDRSPTEFFIAVMAWGLGTDNRGPARAGRILQYPGAEQAIGEVMKAARSGGAAAGYAAYYSGRELPHLGTAFLTKLLHFAAYQQQARPRPLIYDSLVATAAIRLPGAPLLPSTSDGVSTRAYQRYCSWAETTAAALATEPDILEWALFTLGSQLRDALKE
ncbi:MAG: hypothetical protein ACRDRJ_02235 [Streptosporangiaceae bacterium]